MKHLRHPPTSAPSFPYNLIIHRTIARVIAACLSLLLLVAAPLQAQSTNFWNGGGGDSDWSNSSNWSLGEVPVGSDATTTVSPFPTNMVLTRILGTTSSPYVVDYSGTDGMVNGLILSNSTLNVSGTFLVRGPNNNTTYNINDMYNSTLNLLSGASYDNGGAWSALVGSTVNIAAGATNTIGSRLNNYLLWLDQGSKATISGELTSSRGGRLRVGNSSATYGDSSFSVSGGTFGIQNATVVVGGGSTADTTNTINVTSGGTFLSSDMTVGYMPVRTPASGGFSHNAVNLSSGTLTLNNFLTVGRPGEALGAVDNPDRVSTNTINVSGGAMSVGTNISVGVGRVGIVNLSGGSLSTSNNADVSIGGFVTGLITPTTAEHYGIVDVTGGSMSVGQGGVIRVASAIQTNSASVAYNGFSTAGTLSVSAGTVSAGELQVGGFNSANITPDTINPGTVNVSGTGSVTINGVFNLAGATIASGANEGFRTPGVLNISGGTVSAGSLVVTNADGTVNFTGGKLVTQSTSISNGSAFVVGGGASVAEFQLGANGHSFADGLVVADNGLLSGTGSVNNGAVSIASGGTIAPGNSIGTLTVGELSLASGANLVFELTSTAAYDQIVGTSLNLSGGTVNLVLNGFGTQSINDGDTFTIFTGSVANFSNTTFNIINNTEWTGGWELSEGSLLLTAVPEPSTYALLVLAAAGLGAHVVRRRRSSLSQTA